MNNFDSTLIKIYNLKYNFVDFDIECCYTTTQGLKKKINEDRVGIEELNNKLYICICDGHWGDEAANIVKNRILLEKNVFPKDKIGAVEYLRKIEKEIFEELGNEELNGITDMTPETSLIGMELDNDDLSIIAYGDCRGYIISSGGILEIEKINSWIGSFSYLGLRDRLSLEDNIYFKKIKIKSGDIIVLFTDGVDECIYEKLTIPIKDILELCEKNISSHNIVESIFEKVFSYGAEDNASFIVLKIL